MSRVASCFAFSGAVVLAACADEPMRSDRAAGLATLHHWTSQDQATNVQDWHRMARKIADAMQIRGLLNAEPPGTSAAATQATFSQQAFYVRSDQNTPFARELSRALRTEILQRKGLLATSATGAQVVDLGADVVVWGSRARSDPARVRAEGIWYATLSSPDRVLMTVQEPFYVFGSDVHHYVQTPELGRHNVNVARPVRYAQ